MAKEIFNKENNVLWKDRKRIAGMPISFTRYYIVEKPEKWIILYTSIGLLSTFGEEVNLYRIDDISVTQTLADKIFKVGTIKIWCHDSNESVTLYKVKNPYKVRELLTELILKDRNQRGFVYSEFQM